MTENIFLFVPNLIGYVRIILALISFYLMRSHYIWAASLYSLSCLLDAVDGYAARILKQGTKFGGMLDQLTDRCGTMGLLVVLGTFYQKYIICFQFYMIVDIASHWLHVYATVLSGKTSHKNIDENENPLLRIYYSSRQVLFFMCASSEIFFISLYLLHFTEGPMFLFRLLSWLTLPVAVVRIFLALMQGHSAIKTLRELEAKENATKIN